MRLQKFIMPGVFLLGALFNFFFGSVLGVMLLVGLAGGYFVYWGADVFVWRESERRRIALSAEVFKKDILPVVKEMFGGVEGALFGGRLSDMLGSIFTGEPTPGCECDRCKALRAKKTGGGKRW